MLIIDLSEVHWLSTTVALAIENVIREASNAEVHIISPNKEVTRQVVALDTERLGPHVLLHNQRNNAIASLASNRPGIRRAG